MTAASPGLPTNSHAAGFVGRVSPRQLDWLRERLSARDFAILLNLDRLRLLSADHLERLHFTGLTGRSRAVVRGRVLRRLVDWRVITPLGRRIGGARRGSARMVYALDAAGLRLVRERQAAEQPAARVRRPSQAGERFQAHTLAVSELYVALATDTRLPDAGVGLAAFDAEPAAWWPDGLRAWMKPDAYMRLSVDDPSGAGFDDHWWVEVDRATESLPTLKTSWVSTWTSTSAGSLGRAG
jgi:Replication-relaxation